MKKFRYLLLFIPLFFYTQVYADTNTEGISYLTSETELIISNNMGIDINLSPAIENNVSLDIKSIVVSVNYDFKASTNYKLELSTPKAFLTNVDNVSIISNSTTCTFNGITNLNIGYPQILFSCPSDVSYLTFGLSNSSGNNITTGSNFRWNYSYLWKINDTGVNLGPVIENNNQNTQNVIENNNQNTQDVIENNNQNTQDIIDSNKETQEVIKDQFNDCRDSYNLYDINNISNIANYVTVDDDGWITVTYDNSSGTSTVFANVFTRNLNLNTSTKYNIITEIKDVSGTGALLPVTQHQGQGQFTSSTFYDFTNLSSNSIRSAIKTTLDSFDTSLYGLRTYVQFLAGQSGSITFRLSVINNNETFTNYEPFGEEICSNKIDETNDKLNDLNSSLNDSNVDGSLNSAGSFFDSFTTTDHGGLSGIITAPLVAINQMLNTSCSAMTTTFKGKELSLPCGYELWNRLGAIQDFINIVLGGMLCYRIIIKLYKLIERIKNPEDDRLEVMDL